MARLRSALALSPIASSAAVRVRVKSTKEATKPTAMPLTRRAPPPAEPATTTGSAGSTHGESAVTTPARNATTIRVTTRTRVDAGS